jgi:hypothetical protein
MKINYTQVMPRVLLNNLSGAVGGPVIDYEQFIVGKSLTLNALYSPSNVSLDVIRRDNH